MSRLPTIKLPAAAHDFLKTEWGFTAIALGLWVPTLAIGSALVISL